MGKKIKEKPSYGRKSLAISRRLLASYYVRTHCMSLYFDDSVDENGQAEVLLLALQLPVPALNAS